MTRPKSQREILADKKQNIANQKKQVMVQNISKQMITIRLCAPINPDTGKRLDFYRAESGANISPGKYATIVEDRLDKDQISNLKKRGYIKVKPING